jgi:thioredoxin 1
MESKHVLKSSDASFKSAVLESKDPVLVDFWAEWCGPCKQLSPRVEQIAQSYVGKVKVVSVDIDQNPGVPSNYNVRSIPTLLMFKDGQIVGELVGAHPTNSIEELIKKAL